MTNKVFLLCILVITFFVGNILAAEVVDDFPKGSINWSNGIVTAKGAGVPPANAANPAQGRLMAERAAVSDARRNLLEIVGEVRVDAVSTVGSLMTKKDVIMTRISGIVKGSVVTQRRYLDDGSCEVTVEMPITGAFLDVMLSEVKSVPSITMTPPAKPVKKDLPKVEVKTPVAPPESKKAVTEPPKPKTPPVPPSPPAPATPATPAEPVKEAKQTKPAAPPAAPTAVVSAPKEPVKEAKATPEPAKLDLTKVNYSGLIIDARSTDVKPALMPKVVDEKGEVVYSSANMMKEDAVKTGVVGYAKEVDAAKKHPRVTETPVVVAAMKGSGEKRSDVVISDRDAQVITTTEPTLGYLKKGRVMIVYK